MTRLVLSRSAFFIVLLLGLLGCEPADAFSTTSGIHQGPISAGANLPDLCLNWGFNPVTNVCLPEYCENQKVLIVGVPGAFTEIATDDQVMTYLEQQDALKQLGIENVIIYSVNDSAVVGIWNKQRVEAYGKSNTLVTFMADPASDFTRACGKCNFSLFDAFATPKPGF